MSIRMPRLLDESFREKGRLTPLRLSLQLSLTPPSAAEMLLPWDAPAVAVRDLVELYDEKGSAGIFRVTAVEEDIGRTRRLTLEHSLCTLRDSMVGAFAFTGTVREALTRLLAHQTIPRWTVGDVDVPEDMTVVYATGYSDLFSAVSLLVALLPEGYALDFDQSGSTWLLHLRALSADVSCEGRLSRNLQSVRYALDGSRLCTRVYPFGAEVETGLITLVPLEGTDYLSSTEESRWGVVSRTFQSDLIFDVPTLKEVARLYLDRHADPEVTITVEGVDLCSATGEALDSFQLGQICRLALPAMGLTLLQRIVAIKKPDVYGAPGQVVLTLTNRTGYASEEDELQHLVRQVTAGKLLGGAVTEVVDENRAHGSYPSPVVHYFDVKDWAAVLDVRVAFDPDSGVSISALRVDNTYPPEEVWRSGSFSAMPYLTRDELGQIAQGQHWITLHPTNGTYGELCGVSSTVTMTVIEKTTQA